MRSKAMYGLLLAALLPVVIVGCRSADPADTGASTTVAEPYSPPVAQQEPYPTYGSATAVEDTSAAVGGSRTHTVAKGDTLYSLARQYYGDQRRWKDIYNANRSTINDPNMIRVGQRLVIP